MGTVVWWNSSSISSFSLLLFHFHTRWSLSLSLCFAPYTASLSPWQPIQTSFSGPETREPSLVQYQWRHAPAAVWHATLDSAFPFVCISNIGNHKTTQKVGFLTIMNLMSPFYVTHSPKVINVHCLNMITFFTLRVPLLHSRQPVHNKAAVII